MQFSKSLKLVGAHCEGETCNVIVGGIGQVPGETILDKRNFLAEERDWIRKLVLHEPRGQVIHNCNIILPSNLPGADAGFVTMEAIEYPVMSGGNVIAVATVLLETGMVDAVEPITNMVLESAAGPIPVECRVENGKVKSVRFTNQPAFVYEIDKHIEVEGVGTVRLDVAWGGMTYGILDARDFGFSITPDEARDICDLGEKIKIAARDQISFTHPENPTFPGLTNVEFTLPATRVDGVLHAKNTVVVSPGRCDRCPCGTGTSARLALMHAKGEIQVGETLIHKSIIDTTFDSRIESLTKVGNVPAVIPSVAGQAWITELSTVVLDPTDPFPEGVKLTDTWPVGFSL